MPRVNNSNSSGWKVHTILKEVDCSLPLKPLLEGLVELNVPYRGPRGGVIEFLENLQWSHKPKALIVLRIRQVRERQKGEVEQMSENMIDDWFGPELQKQKNSGTGWDFNFWYSLLYVVFYGLPHDLIYNGVSFKKPPKP